MTQQKKYSSEERFVQALNKLFNRVPKVRIYAFFMERAKLDEHLRDQLFACFPQFLPEDSESNDPVLKYYKLADRLFNHLQPDRNGFIDEQYVTSIELPMIDLVKSADEFVDDENYREAFAILRALYDKLPEICINFEEGAIDLLNVLKDTPEIITRITDGCSPQLRTEICEWLLDDAIHPELEHIDIIDNLITIAATLVQTPKQKKKLEILKNMERM